MYVGKKNCYRGGGGHGRLYTPWLATEQRNKHDNMHQWLVQKWKGDKIRIGSLNLAFSGAQKWAEMLHHPCILGVPNIGDKIRIGCLNPASWGATSGRKCYVTPAFSGIPNKGDKIKAQKKQKKQKQKISHGVLDPTYGPANCPHWGLNPGPFNCRGTALPTRVWAISDTPLHRGGIHILSNLVFIHYWVLLKKLSILSIDTWGENPFFHPLLVQANSIAFGSAPRREVDSQPISP